MDHSTEMADSPSSGPGRLRGTMSGLANTAVTYAFAAVTAGIYSLFAFSLDASGPAFFWGWVTVSVSMALICLVFAELASHMPYAASIYHWPSVLAGRKIGWWVGWCYLAALWALVPSYASLFPPLISAAFGVELNRASTVAIMVAFILVAVVINMLGIDLLGRFALWGVAAEIAVIVLVALGTYAVGPHRSPSLLLDSAGTGSSFSGWLPGFLGGGIFVGIWAVAGFETSGTLGEETSDAKRKAPRGILGAFAVSAVMGVVFLAAMLLSIRDVPAIMKSATPIQDIIKASAPDWLAQIYVFLILWVIFLGLNALLAGATRHIYGMAREDMLPFSGKLTETRADGAPWVAAVVIAAATVVPIVLSQDIAVLVTASVAILYLAYSLTLGVALLARTRGWPHEKAPFSLGRMGVVINVLALLCALLTLVNLLWPRDATNPPFGLLDIRVAYWMLGAPAVIGGVYYLLRIRDRISSTSALPGGPSSLGAGDALPAETRTPRPSVD